MPTINTSLPNNFIEQRKNYIGNGVKISLNIDILAWNDPLGTKPPRIKVQVKREKNSINVSVLRSFMALLGDNDVGIFVSTGGFTKDAEDEARTQQSRQVTLINLERLFELWIEHIENLDEESRDLFPLKPIYFLASER